MQTITKTENKKRKFGLETKITSCTVKSVHVTAGKPVRELR
ncbi:hypothetical protein LCGC14_0380600 [marine sediment metagenome]|uniref:Uncharacterized protein n=1 Tax=marine sediment metagenome TaxID=412755 RepID=A0A0F9T8D7_9ZZZZ